MLELGGQPAGSPGRLPSLLFHGSLLGTLSWQSLAFHCGYFAILVNLRHRIVRGCLALKHRVYKCVHEHVCISTHLHVHRGSFPKSLLATFSQDSTVMSPGFACMCDNVTGPRPACVSRGLWWCWSWVPQPGPEGLPGPLQPPAGQQIGAQWAQGHL